MEYLENERYFNVICVLLTEIMHYRTVHIWQLKLHVCLLQNMCNKLENDRENISNFPLTLLQRNRLASSSIKEVVIKVSHIR
jgi:hypothetical protein